MMHTNFIKIVDKHCPVKQFKISKAKPKYINYEIVSLTSDHEYNHLKAKACTPGSARAEEFWKKAVKLCKEVNTKIRNAKRYYIIHNLEESKSKPARFWDTVSELIPKSKSSRLEGVFCPDTGAYKTGVDAAEAINNFFASVGDKLNKMLPQVNEEHMVPNLLNNMPPMTEIDVHSVEIQIDKIDITKSSGMQAINAKLLKLAL